MSFAIAGTVLTVGATAYGANRAGAAGRAAQRGADAATAESGRQYDQTREDFANQRELGQGATNMLGQLFGIPINSQAQRQSQADVLMGDVWLPAGATSDSPNNRRGSNILFNGRQIGRVVPGGPNGRFIGNPGLDINSLALENDQGGGQGVTGTPDRSAFFESPGYQFRRDEGTRGLERSAAARGGAFSGNALRALADFNSGLASQEFGNYVNQLSGFAGLGQTATAGTAAAGADHAANASRNALYAGNARASGIEDQFGAISNGVNQLGSIWGDYGKNKPKKPTVGYYDIDLGGLPRRR